MFVNLIYNNKVGEKKIKKIALLVSVWVLKLFALTECGNFNFYVELFALISYSCTCPVNVRIIFCVWLYLCAQSSLVIAKLACWGKVRLPENDLKFFLPWVKNRLTDPVSILNYHWI